MSEYHLQVPLKDEIIKKLRIGDIIYVSGEAFTSRSLFQKAIFDEGLEMPFSTEGRNLLIHTGPVVVQEMGKWKTTSFGPTTSTRFEKWGAKSIEAWNLKCIIGKATMGEKTQKAMKKFGCIHASPIGINGSTSLPHISIKDVYWKEKLGSIEASWIVEFDKYGPFIVDIDTNGDNYFDELDKVIEENKKKAFAYLDIPEDFEYTFLY